MLVNLPPHIRSLPERQPNQVVLVKKPYGQLKLALGNQGPSFAGMVQVPQARFFDERMDPRWMGTIVWKRTEVTRNAKEMRVRVMATTTKGSPCVLFRGTSVNRGLPHIHPCRLASTRPTVAPAGPAVPVDELEELGQDGQDVITKLHPVPGTDGHNYGQCSRRKAM